MRGGSNVPGRHTFQIASDGIRVFPRIEALVPASVAPVTGRIRSGVPGLDQLMPDGMGRADATLIMGPSGVGKTTFALRWITQGLEDGETCLFVTFQDTADHLIDMGAAFGWDLSAAQAAGRLVISYVAMGDLDLDILANAVRMNLAERPIRRVAIDSLAELVLADREWVRFPAYMRSLVGLVGVAGVSFLATSETAGSAIASESLEGLMFLFDNVIDLRYIEESSGLGRTLNIVKMRNRAHEMTLNQVTITDAGLIVGDRIDGVTGRLGWSALRTQDPPYRTGHASSTPAGPFPNPPNDAPRRGR
jgi:circadian clock protein KaiC